MGGRYLPRQGCSVRLTAFAPEVRLSRVGFQTLSLTLEPRRGPITTPVNQEDVAASRAAGRGFTFKPACPEESKNIKLKGCHSLLKQRQKRYIQVLSQVKFSKYVLHGHVRLTGSGRAASQPRHSEV